MEIIKTVHIQKLTRENWDKALALQLSEKQAKLVKEVTYHIAKAYIMPAGKVSTPFTLYHKDKLIGFFTIEFGKKKYELQAFRIDQTWQNKGLGKAAFEAVRAMIQDEYPLCKMLNMSILQQ